MPQEPRKLPRFANRVIEMMGRDPQLQALMPDAAVDAALRNPDLSYQQVIDTALSGYAQRPALGQRAYKVVVDHATGRRQREYLPRFDTITYLELQNRIKGLANTWRHHELHRVAPGEFVCILGFTGTDYTVVDLACAYSQAVSVPLQSTLAGADLDGIFTDTAPTAVAATVDDLVLAARLAGSHKTVRSIIALDYDEHVDSDREKFETAQTELAQKRSKAKLVTLADLVGFGDFQPFEPLPPNPEGQERMAVLLHSSGSTGKPKGAIMPERMCIPSWDPGFLAPVVRVCFAPLNHLVGRNQVFSTLARGGTGYFTTRPDLSLLFDDIRLARPTELVVFPRALEMVHRHYLGEVVRRRGLSGGDVKTIGPQVRADMRSTFLGDRIAHMIVGSAPTTPEIRDFIKDCFQVPLVDGYGSTETGGSVTLRDRILRPPVIAYKLRDVPELGYYTTDKPYPRGELCIKTKLASPGYFKRPDATAGMFDEEGYILTGDIMEEHGPDHVVYIDRRNDVLKLSQGEYVAIGALGTMFESGSRVIQQMYAYGNSARSYVLAVIVPNMNVVRNRLGANPSEAEIKTLIRTELKAVARAENLKAFEVPRDFIMEFEPFSHENGLLSSVHKRLRPALKAKYGERLEQLYAELERKQNEQLMALQDRNSGLSTLDKIGKALEAMLGVEGVDVTQPLSFADLGGDSLGATAFSALLEEIFGVKLPVNTILSPAANPKKWARAIEDALNADVKAQPTFASVHGKDAGQISSVDLDVTRFIDAETLAKVPIAPPHEVSRTVLMTGATGFLGRFLCLEWLERLAGLDGKLICMVRAADAAAARRRLESIFEGSDPALEERFKTLAGKHLEVIVGDCADPGLGLEAAEFDRLAAEVDHIVHPAALVNHVLSYENLFGPNVVGTAELVRLALTKRQKGIDFISSVATTHLLERDAGNDEDTPLRPKITLSNRYASGYGASKWAGEQLLHSAHRRFGLPVNVFRGDMMLANRRYHEQINLPDVFTRLLYSVVVTGIAPKSFYQLTPDGSRQNAHYDGLPVDFIAAATVGIGAEPHRGIRTFHVLNHHVNDGMSLDQFVDWIEEAGYPVKRIPNHSEWLRQFEARLRALPEEKRQRSSINVLSSLGHPYPAHERMFGSKHFQEAVRKLPVGPDVPHLDQAFILKCLDDMRRLGLIPAPAMTIAAE
jgi:fatty acid CoA ligase FadD9